MSCTAGAASGDVLPALPPIRTKESPAAPEPARSSSASSSTAPHVEPLPSRAAEKEAEGREPEPTTPTSEESRLQPPTKCPPAPRKPAWAPTPGAKRKLQSSSAPSVRRAFFPVARDLSVVFRSLPPKKRIRAG
ncbi:vegetative cell wall protein gp1-like [Phragmites australis]|uniref:vegetative cell wall protein gp1-like n=1 Tax=Phragmites australis TaxID=29695 RepID=UPI002D79C333|nr:vegetative cell wall protein gp1-like [Phragmites australis]